MMSTTSSPRAISASATSERWHRLTARAAQAGSNFAMGIVRQVAREHPEFFSDLPPIANAQKLSSPALCR
jgi:hypothetical protein